MSDSKDSTTDSDTRDSGCQSQSNVLLKSSMLRPSLFGASLKPSDNLKFSIDDAKINPFLKDEKPEEDKDDGTKSAKSDDDKGAEKSDPLSLLSKNGLPKSNLLTAAKNAIPLVESSGFVFGQNVHERVVGENIQTASKSSSESTSSTNQDTEETPSSTSSNLLFSSVIQNNKTEDQSLPKETCSKSLTEIAREYEESRAQKRKYEEVETFTGEENEVNIIDFNCKLFAFVNRNWEERGRGSLRLNDSFDDKGCSRVVFRTSGNLRLLVNTKVWPGMVAERPSQKTLRLTAMDSCGQIKVFLVMSRPDDIKTLHIALVKRIQSAKDLSDENDHKNGSSADDTTTTEPSPKKSAADDLN